MYDLYHRLALDFIVCLTRRRRRWRMVQLALSYKLFTRDFYAANKKLLIYYLIFVNPCAAALLVFFIHLKLELLTIFSASSKQK